MNVWAVIPLKLESQPKRRLANLLNLNERRRLQQAMVEDVVRAVKGAEWIDRIVICSDSAKARPLANELGAELLVEAPDAPRGLNSAMEQAARHIHQHGVSGMLVIHADLPAISSNEIDDLLAQHDWASVKAMSIMPDRFEKGTNCLLCTPPDVVRFHFGPNSCDAHIKAAAEIGIQATIRKGDGGSLDIDTPDDLRALLCRCGIDETQTYKLIHERGGAIAPETGSVPLSNHG